MLCRAPAGSPKDEFERILGVRPESVLKRMLSEWSISVIADSLSA